MWTSTRIGGPVAAAFAVVLCLAVGAACGGSDSTSDAVSATGSVDSQAITVSLHEENDSGQSGTARIMAGDSGVDITVRADDQGVGQLALLARGDCERLASPFAAIAELTSDGNFPTQAGAVRLEDGAPVTLAELGAGRFAVVVVDAQYRGGVTAEIPAETQLLPVTDPNGPYGGTSYPLAACGDVPRG